MGEAVVVLSALDFVEVVHVQLSNERREVLVLEILRQHLIGKFRHLFDGEGRPVLVPRNYFRERRFLALNTGRSTSSISYTLYRKEDVLPLWSCFCSDPGSFLFLFILSTIKLYIIIGKGNSTIIKWHIRHLSWISYEVYI